MANKFAPTSNVSNSNRRCYKLDALKKHSRRDNLTFHLIAMQAYNEIDSIITRETEMDKMTEEERKQILESPPVGTFALMSVVIGGMVVAWLFLYYGVFLPRG
jgi:hypothetical protein